MSSSEEYLESLLQSMMNGEVASPSEEDLNNPDRQKSAISMLTGEEPDPVLPVKAAGAVNTAAATGMEDMEAMLAEMVANLDESEDGMLSDTEITSDINDASESEPTLASSGTEESDAGEISLEDLEIDDMLGDMALKENDADEISLDDLGIYDMAPEESGMDEMPDDMALEETGADEISDDMALEETGADEISLDDLGIDDMAPEESGMDEMPDDMALEESGMDEMPDDMALEETGADEISPDDLGVDDMALEESGMDEMPDDMALEESEMDGMSDDMTIEENSAEEMPLDDLGIDDVAPEESDAEEMPLDDLALEETNADEMPTDELGIDDMALEESGMDDVALEESSMDDIALEESDEGEASLDDLALDDTLLDESGADDVPLDDLGLDDMLLEETATDEMALEEADVDSIEDELSIEEGGMEDDLAEIHDLLDQSDQGEEEIDEEMLALLESVSDSSGDDMGGDGSDDFAFLQNDEEANGSSEQNAGLEEAEEESPKEKKKSRKKRRKGKKGEDLQDNPSETGDSDASETDEGAEKEKKQGIFARFLAFLTETDEDEENSDAAESTDENTELLEELSEEDKKAKKEKKKKEKKEKKEKKGKKASGGEDGEEDGKAAKKKKPKKEKKEKAIDEEAAKADTGKKLSKKKVMPVLLFAATILACILILSSIVPNYLQKRDAQIAYDMGNYSQTFDLLYGKDLNEEEENILHKSTIILKMERKLDSYRNYKKIGNDELKALNTLVQGAALYFELLPEAEQYNVTDKITEVYQEILAVIYSDYDLTETDVMLILDAEDDVAYTKLLTSVIYGISFDEGIEPEDGAGTIEDVLPEEQEILDSLQNNG